MKNTPPFRLGQEIRITPGFENDTWHIEHCKEMIKRQTAEVIVDYLFCESGYSLFKVEMEHLPPDTSDLTPFCFDSILRTIVTVGKVEMEYYKVPVFEPPPVPTFEGRAITRASKALSVYIELASEEARNKLRRLRTKRTMLLFGSMWRKQFRPQVCVLLFELAVVGSLLLSFLMGGLPIK